MGHIKECVKRSVINFLQTSRFREKEDNYAVHLLRITLINGPHLVIVAQILDVVVAEVKPLKALGDERVIEPLQSI